MVKQRGILEKFVAVAETGITANFESWYDGEGMKYWFRFTAVKQGELLVVTTEDITAAKKADEALRESEKFNRNTLESSPDCVKVLDTEGRLTYMNFNGTCIMEIDDFNTVKNKSWWELWPDESKEDIKAAVVKALKGETAQFQAFCPTAKGTAKWWDVMVSPIASVDGSISQLISVSRDITEKKKAAEALIKNEERFRNMIEQAPVAIGLTRGEDFVFESINTPMLQIIHQESKADVLGKKMIEDVLPDMKDQPIGDILRQVLQTGETFKGIEVPVPLTLDGVLYNGYYNISYTRIIEPDGAPSIMHMAIDVTDQVLARRTVEESAGKLKAIVQQTPAPTLVLRGDDFLVEHINSPMLQMMGRSDQVINQPFLFIMPELEGQFAWEQVKKAYYQGTAFDQKEVLVTHKRNGVLQNHYYNVAYRPLEEGDQITGMIQVAIDVTEQVETRKKIEESEEKLQLALDASNMGTFVWQPYEDQGEPDERMLRLFGLSQSSKLNLTEALASIIHPDDALRYAEEVKRATDPSGIGTLRSEFRIIHPDQTMHWILIYGQTSFDAETKTPIRMSGLATDITQQVEARKKLEESEERYRTLIEETTVATAFYTGPEIRIQFANATMLRYWGKGQEVIGKTFREALPELEGQPFPGLLEAVYATGRPYSGTEEKAELLVERDLRSFYFNFTYKALRDAQGHIYAVHHTAIDVTEQVMTRQKIEEQATALRNAIEIAELGTWKMDVESGGTQISERQADMLGINKSFLTAEEGMLSVDAADRERVMKVYAEAMRPESSGRYDSEFRITNAATGKTHVLRTLGQSRFDAAGNLIGMEGTSQDVTLQRQLQSELEAQVKQRTKELAEANETLQDINRELQRSNANLEEFAHAASHDLKEPIRKITFFTHQLKDQLGKHLNDAEVRSFGRIENATVRMGSLIDDLLIYSHVSQRPHETESVDVNIKVQRVLEDLELDIEKKGAVINIGKLPIVKGYGRQLQQLFQNLISNALKYSKADVPPQIDITTKLHELESKRYHSISVKDNGIGFDQEYDQKIFQMFARLHGKGEYSGTGVGLSIVKKVVENHHGYIKVESTPGEGSTFCVLLPAE